MDKLATSQLIKRLAADMGFFFCGVSKAEFMEEEAKQLESWLKKDHHGQMGYMANNFDKRTDPTKLVPGAKTVVSLMYNYYSEPVQQEGVPKVSRYAYGTDYHKVVKDKLFELLNSLRQEVGDIQGRVFVDSAPVLERAWAERAGGGWIGKNTNLISKGAGSYYFLAELIIDLEAEPDGPATDHCGTCTRCLDACPTNAIVEPYVVDGSRCISYFTIELKDEIPKVVSGQFEDWVFGCDICQEVCPWNKFSGNHKEPLFNASEEFKRMDQRDWKEITEEVFERLFSHTPLTRAGYQGLRRNIDFLKKR